MKKVALLGPDGQLLTDDEELAIRTPKDFLLDITGVNQRLADLKEHVDTVKLWIDNELQIKGVEKLRTIFGEKLAEQKR